MSHSPAILLASAAVTLLLPRIASSRADIPAENHYKVYKEAGAEIPAVIPLTLKDQFGVVNVDIIQRTLLATPVSKDGSIVYDDKAHQTWFEIHAPQPEREVTVTDQFGTSTWRLGDVTYLVAPAVKYPLPNDRPPVRNHYLCYDAKVGPSIGRPVVLVDQFDNEQVLVLYGKLLCNPVEKTTADGTVYPVVDPMAHLACYLFENPNTYHIPFVIMLDQFGNPEMTLVSSDCLCNPALKGPVAAEQSTWGRIKALYR